MYVTNWIDNVNLFGRLLLLLLLLVRILVLRLSDGRAARLVVLDASRLNATNLVLTETRHARNSNGSSCVEIENGAAYVSRDGEPLFDSESYWIRWRRRSRVA